MLATSWALWQIAFVRPIPVDLPFGALEAMEPQVSSNKKRVTPENEKMQPKYRGFSSSAALSSTTSEDQWKNHLPSLPSCFWQHLDHTPLCRQMPAAAQESTMHGIAADLAPP